MVSLVIGVLILSILVPIILSIWLAHYQAKKDFISALNIYGQRIIMRTERVATRATTALKEIDAYKGTPCSQEHLQAMRRISYTMPDIQEVLWLDGQRPLCSSLESKSSNMFFPPHHRRTHDGYRTWLTAQNDLGIHHYMVAIASANHMVMVDPASLVDVIPFDSWTIHAAIMASETGAVIAKNHSFDLSLWKKARHDGVQSFLHDGVLYDIREYPNLGISLLVWSSAEPLTQSWHRQLLIWLPVGMVISVIGALVIMRILRHLQSPYHRMRDAINTRAIQVYYQPIVSLRTGHIVGAEALARWPQPDGSFLSPDIFIPLAEQSGLTQRLTSLVMERVFEDLGPWLKLHPDQHISINLAPEDLSSSVLSMTLTHLLQRSGVIPSQIALELTERSFADPVTSLPIIQAWRQAGHAIYIDDFGTGYSSLSYLQDLDIDVLKIDKSFVDALEYKTVTPYIIEMAKTLKLSMVAEGIETPGQQEWLFRHGVQFGQGWLYSKALPKEAFMAWAESHLAR